METLIKILNLGKDKMTLGNLLIAVIIFLISSAVIRLILKPARRSIEKSKLDSSGVGFIITVIKIVLYFIAVTISCDFIGIPVSSLIAVLSVAGLALSLAVQDLLSNLLSGFVILMTKPFAGGDFIELGGISGTVKSIGFMHTRLSTPDQKTIYIPNHEICISNIINYSRADTRRVGLIINASYDSPVENVKKSITESFSKVEGIHAEPAPFVGVKEFGNSAIVYDVRCWCDNTEYWNVYYALNEQIKKDFDKNGIEMTYDHINVHMVEK